MTELSDSIIAILAPNGYIAGTGFLVAPDLALTCAHVIESALSGPGMPVAVRYHRGSVKAEATVGKECWSDRTDLDIALLHLPAPPEGVVPLPLGRSLGSDGHEFATFGYPDLVNIDGAGGRGEIISRVRTQEGRELLQLRSGEIDNGNSGGPVFDASTMLVVGMVSMVYRAGERKTFQHNALATPSEILIKICNTLSLHEPEDRKSKSESVASFGDQATVQGDVFTGDKKIYNYFIQGLPGLGVDYSAHIQRFLDEYLGLPGAPRPFGGRSEKLKELDNWIQGRAEKRLGLVAAEVGRGKSALLVRWSVSLIERGTADVIFIPVSIRFNTAQPDIFLSSLAMRLAHYFGEDQQGMVGASADQWREVCLSYFQRTPADPSKPLVVILDGLDEATVPGHFASLFPYQPSTGVFILVSARLLAGDKDESGWMQRLNWDQYRAVSFSLPLLSKEGLVDIIRKVGEPLEKLVSHEDGLVDELYRLTEKGEPLIVRLYIDALLPRGAQPAAIEMNRLSEIKEAGLEGIINRLWTDQRKLWQAQGKNPDQEELKVERFLNLCSMALGALMQDDVAAITAGELPAGSALRQVAEASQRFIIGDGLKTGYVYSHPGLTQFFKERMGEAEQESWKERFLAYCRETVSKLIDGTLSTKRASRYAIAHFSEHLELSEAPIEEYLVLLSGPWLEACRSSEKGLSGFLTDVDKAWEKAREVEVKYLDLQVLAALCHSSAASLSTNVRPELLANLVRYSVIDLPLGLSFARRNPDPAVRCEALLQLAIVSQQDELFSETYGAALSITEPEVRAQKLLKLLPYIAEDRKGKLISDIKTIAASNVTTPSQRVEFLQKISPYLLPEEREKAVLQAYELANEIKYDWSRKSTLEALVPDLPQEKIVELFERIDFSEVSAYYDTYWAAILNHLPAQVLHERLPELLNAGMSSYSGRALFEVVGARLGVEGVGDAVESILRRPLEFYGREILCALAPYASPETLERILSRVLGENPDYNYEAYSLLGCMGPFLDEGQYRYVMQVMRKAENDYTRYNLIEASAELLPETFLDEAVELALSMKGAHERLGALSLLAGRYQGSRKMELKQGLLEDIVQNTTQGSDKRFLINMASSLTEHEVASLLGLIEREDEDSGQVYSYQRLAERLPPEHLHLLLDPVMGLVAYDSKRILTILCQRLPADGLAGLIDRLGEIETELDRREVLIEAAKRLPEAGFARFFASVMELRSDADKAQAVTGAFENIPEQMYQSLLVVLDSIEDPTYQEQVLELVLPRLPQQLLAPVLVRRYESTRIVSDSLQRLKTLAALSGYLDEEQTSLLREEALALARGMQDPLDRSAALGVLCGLMPEDEQVAIQQEAFNALGAVTDDVIRQGALTTFPRQFDGSMKEKAVEIVLEWLETMPPGLPRVQLLWNIASSSAGERAGQLISRAFDEAKALESDGEAVGVFKVLFPKLDQDQILEAKAHIDGFDDPENREDALVEILKYLPVELHRQVIQKVFEGLTEELPTNYRYSQPIETLKGLAPYLEPDLLPRYLEQAYELTDRGDYGDALLAIAHIAPEHLLPLALERLDESGSVDILQRIVTKLSPERLKQLLDGASQVTDTLQRGGVTIVLASVLPEAERAQVIKPVMAVMKEAFHREAEINPLMTLLSFLPEKEFEELFVQLALSSDVDEASDAELYGVFSRIPAQNQADLYRLILRYPDQDDTGEFLMVITQSWPEIAAATGTTETRLLSEALQSYSKLSREKFLQVLVVLAPAIDRLGEPGIVWRVCGHIKAAAQWWP